MNKISTIVDNHCVEQSLSQGVEVSVTVQTYNRSKLLVDCLSSLMNQKLEDGLPRYEIIVVDNNSSDDTGYAVEQMQAISTTVPLRYVTETRQGLSHARNTSVMNARGKFVAFLDDDGVAESNWLLELWRAIQSAPDLVCAYGQTLPRWEVDPPGWLDSRFGLYVGFYDLESISRRRKETVLGGGGNAIYLREAVLTAGGFPIDLGRSGESLLAGEEIELGTKLLAAGGKSCYAPKAIMHHWIPADRMSLEYMKRRGFGVGQSLSTIRIRNQGLLAAAIHVPWNSMRILQTGVLALLDVPSRRQSHRHFMACMVSFLFGYIKPLQKIKFK